MNIYFIPGLGFDDRIFHQLNLGARAKHYINWIEPEANENIQNYAARMSEIIDDTAGPVIVIGHSFGGVLSQEIARLKKVEKIILISSIKSRAEIPFYFKFVQPLGLSRFFTKKIIFSSFRFWASSYGYPEKEDQDLFKSMISKQSNTYLQWALNKLSTWQTIATTETQILHIHGDKDNTLPFSLIQKPVIRVPGGGHFMVYKDPELISQLISKVLNS